MSKAIELPSLLSFDRKLETSDALMYSGNWTDIENKSAWQKIAVTKRYNRSTQSAYGIDDAKKSEPNPVSSDSDDANLPHDKDTLKVTFTTRVIGNIGQPFACNEPAFEALINQKVTAFKADEKQLEILAYRYAYNIANGRFLWRNRVSAEKVSIEVRHGADSQPLIFDGHAFSLQNFDKNKDDKNLQSLTQLIQSGLNAVDDFTLLEVIAYVKIGKGQHVFPSQEMNMGKKGKVLFKLDDCAAIHNVKIGNALRTIDDWYENAEFPIAAEPYGSVTQRGQAYRKSKNDLYTLILAWLNGKDITTNDKNFVVANLIRGGVFSGESKKKKG